MHPESAAEPCPLVSVVTATYNRADLLPETIESVLAQDYPRIEYIVLDDGSTDDTRGVLARYGDRIRWESHPNMGESRTVNKGWSMARGEFILTVSSDDPLRPGLVARGVRFLQQRPEVLVAYPDWVVIDRQSRVLEERSLGEYDYLTMLRWHHCYPGPGSIMRRRCLELAGLRDPKWRYVADFEYWLRVGLHGPMARLPETLATWRLHAGATTEACRGRQMAEEHVRMIEEFFIRPDLPDDVRGVCREALGAANFVAGEQCGSADVRAARQYYHRCLELSDSRSPLGPGGRPFPWRRYRAMSLPAPLYRGALLGWQGAKRLAKLWAS